MGLRREQESKSKGFAVRHWRCFDLTLPGRHAWTCYHLHGKWNAKSKSAFVHPSIISPTSCSLVVQGSECQNGYDVHHIWHELSNLHVHNQVEMSLRDQLSSLPGMQINMPHWRLQILAEGILKDKLSNLNLNIFLAAGGGGGCFHGWHRQMCLLYYVSCRTLADIVTGMFSCAKQGELSVTLQRKLLISISIGPFECCIGTQ